MKLLNNTPIPDAILIALLVRAGRTVGAKTTDVVVQINRSHWYLSPIRATAYDAGWVRWGGGSGRKLSCDEAFRISLPLLNLIGETDPSVIEHKWCNYDALTIAQRFYEVARHEFGHIRDYQQGGRYFLRWSKCGNNNRRPRHDSRPEEIRAENYAYDADRAGRNANAAVEEIVALGVVLEERANRK
jgi:hypothetical protein